MAVDVVAKLKEADEAIHQLFEGGAEIPAESLEMREIMERCIRAEAALGVFGAHPSDSVRDRMATSSSNRSRPDSIGWDDGDLSKLAEPE